jgi:hypothetical protein
MKATYSALLLAAVTFSATAQKAENDDMYFTARDRAKVKEVTVSASKPSVQQEKATAESTTDATLNPTDSYSARNVNPDYNSGKPGAPKADYFVEDYTPTGVNGNLNGDYSASSPSKQSSYYNNNPYAYNPYSSFGTGWGYPAGGMYSMGGMYPMDPYGMSSFGYPYSPYSYGSRMMMSYGMSFGYNPWMYNSMSMAYGYGMYDPFMMSSMYCPYSFYGYNSGYSSYYPGTVVDNNQNGRNVAYGKRSERSTAEQYQNNDTRPAVTQSRTGRTISSGRTRSADGTQEYYERGWKNNTNTSTGSTERATRSFWTSPNQDSGQPSNSTSRTGRTNDVSSWGSSSWDNNSNNSGSSWSTGGNRSSWSGGSSSGISTGGGTRSSGGSSSGGGTRGRD